MVPGGGSSTIENAGDGFIVIDVMVSAALPVFAMMTFFSRVATLPNNIGPAVTASRLKDLALASGEACWAEAKGARAQVRKTQAQSAAMYRRNIAPHNDDASLSERPSKP